MSAFGGKADMAPVGQNVRRNSDLRIAFMFAETIKLIVEFYPYNFRVAKAQCNTHYLRRVTRERGINWHAGQRPKKAGGSISNYDDGRSSWKDHLASRIRK